MGSKRKGLQKDHKTRKQQRNKSDEPENTFGDDYFMFVAGYTSGGAAFGVTVEEWQVMEDIEDERAADEAGWRKHKWEARKKHYNTRSSKWSSRRPGYSPARY